MSSVDALADGGVFFGGPGGVVVVVVGVEREGGDIGGGGGDGEFGWWRPAGGSGGVFDAGGGGDGVGAVGVYVVGPSSAVVVEVFVTAFGDGVGDVGAAAGLPRDDVVDVAALRRCVTPGDATSSVAGEHGAALGGGERADRPAVVQDPPVGGEKSFQGPAGGQTRHQAVGDGVPVEGGRGGTGAFERVAEQAALDGAEVGAGVEEPVEVIGGDHPGAAQRGPVQHPDVSDDRQPFLAAVPVGVRRALRGSGDTPRPGHQPGVAPGYAVRRRRRAALRP